jgi:hypothetical protein
MGKTIQSKDKTGKVIRHNVIGRRIAIRLDDGSELEIGVDDIDN